MKPVRGYALTDYEFLARQEAELPAYRSLKLSQLAGDMREVASAVVADLSIYLGEERSLCEEPTLHQEIEEGDEPLSRLREHIKKPKPEPRETGYASDRQRARLARLFAEYSPSQLQSACALPDFARLTDEEAERGSLYAPFVTNSTVREAGTGIFAGRSYDRAKLPVAAYDGDVLPTKDVRSPLYKTAYAVMISRKWSVDARANPWTPGRYVNQGHPKSAMNTGFVVNYATRSVRLSTTRSVDRGEEFFTDYGKEYWESGVPESDANTLSLDGRFLDYYYSVPPQTEEEEERKEEAALGDWEDASAGGEAPPQPPLTTPEEEAPPAAEGPPAPVPAPYKEEEVVPSAPPLPEPAPSQKWFNEDGSPMAPWRTPAPYWIPHRVFTSKQVAQAISNARAKAVAKIKVEGVCDNESWEQTSMSEVGHSPDKMPLLTWNANSCFFDAVVVSIFAPSNAFDPVFALPTRIFTPEGRAGLALERPLRRLINALRTSPKRGKPLDESFNDNVRKAFQDSPDLPLDVKRAFGKERDKCNYGAPDQLFSALMDQVFQKPWALFPLIERRGEKFAVLDRYPSFMVHVIAYAEAPVGFSLASRVIGEWTDDGAARLVAPPHAFVVNYDRGDVVPRDRLPYPIPRELKLADTTYWLRSLVVAKGGGHFVSFVADGETGDWHYIDAHDDEHRRAKLIAGDELDRMFEAETPAWGVPPGGGRHEMGVRLPMDSTLLLYESADFWIATREQQAPSALSVEEFFGTQADSVVREVHAAYRTLERAGEQYPQRLLRPPRSFDASAALTKSVLPFPNSAFNAAELLLVAVTSAGEAWDYALSNTPEVLRRVDIAARTLAPLYPPGVSEQVDTEWIKRGLFLLANPESEWKRRKGRFDPAPLVLVYARRMASRRAFFRTFVNPTRNAFFYPAIFPASDAASYALRDPPTDADIGEMAREAAAAMVGGAWYEGGALARLSGVAVDGAFWLPPECTLRAADGTRLLITVDPSPKTGAFDQDALYAAFSAFGVSNLPIVFVASARSAVEVTDIATRVDLKRTLGRCFDLAGAGHEYSLVGALLLNLAKVALVHRPAGAGFFWVRGTDLPPIAANSISEAAILLAKAGFAIKPLNHVAALVYQSSKFDSEKLIDFY